ncbi:MAG: DUF1846 family protein [Bacteroidetes bacterium]|nr:DUF1846 family protein [Bacteroidota bacterium]MBT5527613.1 DUF1846 family protein [Cytophagia bacterium]MBT3934250.1 DUF1846 family protein [Bacteroidota bacterium]MBT4728702.1 DUF1846 family protein [Bacteroidota bacterium]MBT4968735.1 DUF1846 family protein [Bacteroidota bacterium]
MKKIGFDTDKYLNEQSKKIHERVAKFEKLYLEFGGKLCYDLHAVRVLPGYRATAKIDLLKKLGDIDIIYCISSKDILRGRVRRDFGLTYANQTLKDISDINEFGLSVSAVVITRYEGESSIDQFKSKLENYGIKVYIQTEIEGYPNNLEKVLRGYDNQPYVVSDKKLTIITGAGGGSGKMAVALSQIHHERKMGIKTGFAKFETFPIWNLELNHPINVAYEAATADMLDVNLVDPFHKEAYNQVAINYNRDIENFTILHNLMKRITGELEAFGYRSPTDMGVNMAKEGIIDNEACSKAGKEEILRRYFRYHREKIEGIETQETIDQMQMIMDKVNVKPEDRKVVEMAELTAKKGEGFDGVSCGAAIQLSDGKILTGKNSKQFHAESAVLLNAIKELSKIPDEIDLLSPEIIKSITELKFGLLNRKGSSLNVNETLIALAMSGSTNPAAKHALNKLNKLKNCEMHLTHLPTPGDEVGLIRLKMNVTTSAKISSIPDFQ